MKKTISAIVSLVGIAVFFSCRNKLVFATAPANKSLLWEVSGKDLKKASYFLGTMHLMCAEDAALSENVKKLIKNVDHIYLEVDLDNASELLSGIMDIEKNNGHSLSETLSANDYNKIKSFFEKYQPSVPFSVFEKQPPLMISSALYEFLLPCEQTNGIEMKIIDEAYKSKKPTKGLETIEFQSSIIDSIPYEDQAKELVTMLDSLDKNRSSMQEMLKVYKAQDIEKLHDLSVSDQSITHNYLDLFLYNRNKNWVKRFPAIAKDSVTLFAVGAGHLGGEKGVLDLLKKEGYTVRPIVN